MRRSGPRSSDRRHAVLASVRRRSRIAGTIVAVAIAVGACSSDVQPLSTANDGSIPTVPTATVTTDAPTTTQAANATTPLVRQAVLDYWAADRACGQRPKQCKPESFTAAQGTLRSDVQSYVATLLSKQYHLAAPDTVPSGGTAVSTDDAYVVVKTVTVDLATNATATTDECVYDPTPMLGPTGADGQPTVVSSDAVPHHFLHTFYLEDGHWLPGIEQVDTADPTDTCAETQDTVPVDFTTPGS